MNVIKLLLKKNQEHNSQLFSEVVIEQSLMEAIENYPGLDKFEQGRGDEIIKLLIEALGNENLSDEVKARMDKIQLNH